MSFKLVLLALQLYTALSISLELWTAEAGNKRPQTRCYEDKAKIKITRLQYASL